MRISIIVNSLNDDEHQIYINKVALAALDALAPEEATKFILKLIDDDTVATITAGSYKIEVSFEYIID